MGGIERLVDWGYDRFVNSRFKSNPAVVTVACLLRDGAFYATLLRAGALGQQVTRTDVLDHELYVDLADSGVSRTLVLRGEYESRLTRACSNLVDPGATVVDVGANIGYFTVLFSELVGDRGTVYAFEPDPRNYELLERNVELNGCDNVVAERVAVSDTPGTVDLHIDEDQHSRHSIVRSDQTGSPVRVDAVTLDDRVDGAVDLLKVDVVGAEPLVLDGATELIAADRPRIVLPYVPDKWDADGRALFDRLDAAGYSVRTMEGDAVDDPWRSDEVGIPDNVVLEPAASPPLEERAVEPESVRTDQRGTRAG